MSYLSSLFRETEEMNRQDILEMLPHHPVARLLDLGCNDGAFTMRLAERIGTRNITGVEVSPKSGSEAAARGITVVAANLNEPIPLPNASFDIIHANQVIEHLDDTDSFAREIYRLLAPQGIAVLSTNNLSSLHNIGSLALGLQPPPAHISRECILGNLLNPANAQPIQPKAMSHLRIFSYFALRAFLRYHGFRIDEYRVTGFYPWRGWLARIGAIILPIYGAYLLCRISKDPLLHTSDKPC